VSTGWKTGQGGQQGEQRLDRRRFPWLAPRLTDRANEIEPELLFSALRKAVGKDLATPMPIAWHLVHWLGAYSTLR